MAQDSLKATIGVAALLVAIVLPMLILVPFGWLWLWQHGYVLIWLGAALVISLVAFGIRMWLLRRLKRELELGDKARAGLDAQSAPRELAARATVERLAAEVVPARITDRDALLTLGVETVEAVARDMHPQAQDPLWAFTVPEALTLIERVARRLRPLLVENVPLGDRLTVGQLIRLYKWRGLVDLASQAYDIWRVVRLMNPVAAATQEIRERLSKSMYEGLRQELAKRLAATYVREVGSAAIDLYSGRLAVPAAETHPSFAAEPASGDSEAPLRLLIAGQIGSGKSSLINALAEEVEAATDALPQTKTFAVYEVQRQGMPPVALIDSPGLGRSTDAEAIAAKLDECDLLIWVAAADRPDRALDRAALAAVRRHFAAAPDRPAPPMVVILTHIDRLRPFQEWSPPYNVAEPDSAKARSIREAIAAAAEDLGLSGDRIVPVSLSPERGHYNVDLVWGELAEALPAAKSAHLLRRVASARRAVDWRRLWGQAVGAGRLAADVLIHSARSGGPGKGA
jgi:predicted GTPase